MGQRIEKDNDPLEAECRAVDSGDAFGDAAEGFPGDGIIPVTEFSHADFSTFLPPDQGYPISRRYVG